EPGRLARTTRGSPGGDRRGGAAGLRSGRPGTAGDAAGPGRRGAAAQPGPGAQPPRHPGDALGRGPPRPGRRHRAVAPILEGAVPARPDRALRAVDTSRRRPVRPLDPGPHRAGGSDPEAGAPVTEDRRPGRGVGGGDADGIPGERGLCHSPGPRPPVGGPGRGHRDLLRTERLDSPSSVIAARVLAPHFKTRANTLLLVTVV